jgi:hypothetical protein
MRRDMHLGAVAQDHPVEVAAWCQGKARDRAARGGELLKEGWTAGRQWGWRWRLCKGSPVARTMALVITAMRVIVILRCCFVVVLAPRLRFDAFRIEKAAT